MENEIKILGIDPGLQICGYACLHKNKDRLSLAEAGVFKTDSEKQIHNRLNQIAEDLNSLLDSFSPDIVAVEQLYSHYAHPKTAILMGHARGVILQCCAARNIELKSFSATRIKKSLTGNGRASKQQIQRTIQTVLNLAELPEPPDVADAIAASLCCANAIDRNELIKSNQL